MFLPLVSFQPPSIHWRTDWDRARTEARASKKPLFVLFQCVRNRKPDSDSIVFAGTDPKLRALLTANFIPVRLTSVKNIDLNLFDFDFDLSFAGLVLTPSGATLGRWGSPNGKSSLTELKTLLEATAHTTWPSFPSSKPQTIVQKYPWFAQQKSAQAPCYHCHYVSDAAIGEARTRKTFDKQQLYRYPSGETLGLGELEKDVPTKSPAALAGLRSGDRLLAVDNTRIYTSADLAYALDHVPQSARSLHVTFRRGTTTKTVTLSLPDGWRRSDISWRPSQGAVPPFLGTWEELLSDTDRTDLGIARDRLALRINYLFPGERWQKTRGALAIGDVIIGVDGKELESMSARQFHTWFRMNKSVGEQARLSVIRLGKRIEISVPCLDVFE